MNQQQKKKADSRNAKCKVFFQAEAANRNNLLASKLACRLPPSDTQDVLQRSGAGAGRGGRGGGGGAEADCDPGHTGQGSYHGTPRRAGPTPWAQATRPRLQHQKAGARRGCSPEGPPASGSLPKSCTYRGSPLMPRGHKATVSLVLNESNAHTKKASNHRAKTAAPTSRR